MTKIWLENLKHPLDHYDRATIIRAAKDRYYVLAIPEGSSWAGGERASLDVPNYSWALSLEGELHRILAAHRKMTT